MILWIYLKIQWRRRCLWSFRPGKYLPKPRPSLHTTDERHSFSSIGIHRQRKGSVTYLAPLTSASAAGCGFPQYMYSSDALLYKSFTSPQSSNSLASCPAVSRCFAAVHCLAARFAVKDSWVKKRDPFSDWDFADRKTDLWQGAELTTCFYHFHNSYVYFLERLTRLCVNRISCKPNEPDPFRWIFDLAYGARIRGKSLLSCSSFLKAVFGLRSLFCQLESQTYFRCHIRTSGHQIPEVIRSLESAPWQLNEQSLTIEGKRLPGKREILSLYLLHVELSH